MKKLFILILLCALTIGLCACSVKTTTYPDGQVKLFGNDFTLIKSASLFGSGTCYYIYDNNTKIMYLYTRNGYQATMCPYYIIINDKPELAIYGINWIE